MVFAVLIPLKEGEMEHTVTVLVVQHARIVTIDRVVHPGAQSALRRILKNDFCSVRARDVVDALPFSNSTLKRRFTAEYGVPLARFLRWHAIVKSLGLLASNPYRDLGWVANEVGYAVVPSLVRVWRREAGVTPGAAARALRGMNRTDLCRPAMLAAARRIDAACRVREVGFHMDA
jgi:AraC-like DNA-binding protein